MLHVLPLSFSLRRLRVCRENSRWSRSPQRYCIPLNSLCAGPAVVPDSNSLDKALVSSTKKCVNPIDSSNHETSWSSRLSRSIWQHGGSGIRVPVVHTISPAGELLNRNGRAQSWRDENEKQQGHHVGAACEREQRGVAVCDLKYPAGADCEQDSAYRAGSSADPNNRGNRSIGK